MDIEEQAIAVVDSDGPILEDIRAGLEKLGCMTIAFWGTEGDGRPYEIKFFHTNEWHTIGPYQYVSPTG